MRRLVAALALTAVLAGCGSDGPLNEDTSPTTHAEYEELRWLLCQVLADSPTYDGLATPCITPEGEPIPYPGRP